MDRTNSNKPTILIATEAFDLTGEFNVLHLKDLYEKQTDLSKIEGILMNNATAALEHPILDKMTNLKIVVPQGIGLDYMEHLITYFQSRNIRIARCKGDVVMCKAVADVAVCLMLNLARGVHRGIEFVRSSTGMDPRAWVPWREDLLSKTLHVTGSTIGIIGMGRVGSQVAKRAKFGFDMNVLYHNRNQRPQEHEQDIGATFVSRLDDMLPQCDIVTICCSLNIQSNKLIGAQQLRLMKTTALIVNVSRGGVIDTEALTEALQEGQIGGVGLDVTDPEPLAADHPLRGMHNAIITPHMAYAVPEVVKELRESILANLKRVLIEGNEDVS